MNVRTIDDFTKSVDALVYYIDPDNEEMKIAYPNLLFDHNIDGRTMMCSFLTLATSTVYVVYSYIVFTFTAKIAKCRKVLSEIRTELRLESVKRIQDHGMLWK